jgi:hypothetical protein
MKLKIFLKSCEEIALELKKKLIFLDCFNVLKLKINFKNKKIILIYLQTKNTLKNNI